MSIAVCKEVIAVFCRLGGNVQLQVHLIDDTVKSVHLDPDKSLSMHLTLASWSCPVLCSGVFAWKIYDG